MYSLADPKHLSSNICFMREWNPRYVAEKINRLSIALIMPLQTIKEINSGSTSVVIF